MPVRQEEFPRNTAGSGHPERSARSFIAGAERKGPSTPGLRSYPRGDRKWRCLQQVTQQTDWHCTSRPKANVELCIGCVIHLYLYGTRFSSQGSIWGGGGPSEPMRAISNIVRIGPYAPAGRATGQWHEVSPVSVPTPEQRVSSHQDDARSANQRCLERMPLREGTRCNKGNRERGRVEQHALPWVQEPSPQAQKQRRRIALSRIAKAEPRPKPNVVVHEICANSNEMIGGPRGLRL
jgi:hypothetical protein